MNTSKAGVDLIKHFEGFQEHAYLCSAGVPTLGYGHTSSVKLGQTITKLGAENLLKMDLFPCEHAVKGLVTRPLTQNQFDALISFIFNLGEGAFSKSTLLKRINESKDSEASMEFLKWVNAGGRPLEGLAKRRKAESYMYMGLPWENKA